MGKLILTPVVKVMGEMEIDIKVFSKAEKNQIFMVGSVESAIGESSIVKVSIFMGFFQ